MKSVRTCSVEKWYEPTPNLSGCSTLNTVPGWYRVSWMRAGFTAGFRGGKLSNSITRQPVEVTLCTRAQSSWCND